VQILGTAGAHELLHAFHHGPLEELEEDLVANGMRRIGAQPLARHRRQRIQAALKSQVTGRHKRIQQPRRRQQRHPAARRQLLRRTGLEQVGDLGGAAHRIGDRCRIARHPVVLQPLGKRAVEAHCHREPLMSPLSSFWPDLTT